MLRCFLITIPSGYRKRGWQNCGTTVSTINYHLKQIDESGEILCPKQFEKLEFYRTNGMKRVCSDVFLDVIIAVGYRVSSYEGLSMVPLFITLGAYIGEYSKSH